MNEPLVSVCCVTFNHRNYIRDAIDSFLMQRTTFPFEILIHDDASTDGTADIVRQYEKQRPQLIFPIYQTENQWSKGNNPGRINRERARGKYLAYCEGDDYWTDPYKLQKQVDFLEAHPDYGLVHTDNSNYNKNSGKFIKSHKAVYYPNPPSGNVFQDLLIKNFISTLTVVVRADVMNEANKSLDDWFNPRLIMDYALWLEISTKTKIKYIGDITAVYRLSDNSTSRPGDDYAKSIFQKKRFEIAVAFIEHYEVDARTKNMFYDDFFNTYLKKIYRYKEFYQFAPKDLADYIPKNVTHKILRYLHANRYSQRFYFFAMIPFKIIENIRNYFRTQTPIGAWLKAFKPDKEIELQ